ALAGGLVVLAGCSGGADEPAATSAVTADPADDASATSSAAPEEAAGDPVTRWLTPVPVDDAPRELTELERTMLFEPGPFAKEAELPADALLTDAEREQAAAASAALDPQTEHEWI